MRMLMLLRHAKSDWDSGAVDDFARPLAERGRKAAERMGVWMRRHAGVPDYVISSPAVRVRETVRILCEVLGRDATQVVYEDSLYLADAGELLSLVHGFPDEAKSVMLVGHNPGLEELLVYLCGDDVPTAANGKLLPTAALAQIAVAAAWRNLRKNSGRLIAITRPREL
jgi:phosphohistidine phosphatase